MRGSEAHAHECSHFRYKKPIFISILFQFLENNIALDREL